MTANFIAAILVATAAIGAAALFVLRSAVRSRAESASSQSNELGLLSSVRATRYLTTRPNWRYAVPWFLVVGAEGAGKSSIASSLQSSDRQNGLLQRAGKTLDEAGTYVFDQGVLVEHAIAGADPVQRLQEQRGFLRELVKQRPGRPIDGVVLVIRAQDLQSEEPGAIRGLADELYEQLFELQRAVEFSLPVYLVVSQCDAVAGFDDFWGQLHEDRRSQIVGWSTDDASSQAFEESWFLTIRNSLADRFNSLRLRGTPGNDARQAEAAFLFPNRLLALLEPLQTVATRLFASSAFQAGYLLRGIYFSGAVGSGGTATGSVRDDVSFVRELVSKKVFAERNLGVPLTTGVWSRSPWQRAAQYVLSGVLGIWILLAVNAGFAYFSQVDALAASLNNLSEITDRGADTSDSEHAAVCIDQADADRLLITSSRIDARFASPFIPASYFDSLVDAKAEWVANEVFEKVIFPGFQCHLEQRASDFMRWTDQIGAESNFDEALYFRYLDAADRLWTAAKDFQEMSEESNSADEAMVVRNLELLSSLYSYIYSSTLPADIDRENTRLGLSLTKTEYPQRLSVPGVAADADHPLDGLDLIVGGKITDLTTRLRDWVLNRLRSGGGASFDDRQSIRGESISPMKIVEWADWVSGTWTGRTAANNACTDYSSRIGATMRKMMGAHFNFNLRDIETAFSAQSCYGPAARVLRSISWPGVGNLFEQAHNDGYRLTSGAQQAVSRFRQASQLGFIGQDSAGTQVCQVQSAGWDRSKLLELEGYLHEFANFAESATGDDARVANEAVEAFVIQSTRSRLRRAAQDLIYGAQVPLQPLSARLDLQPVSRLEKALSDTSVRFANVVQTLDRVQGSLAEQGLDDVRLDLARCVESFVADQLAYASTLADVTQIYRPTVRSAELPPDRDAAIFEFASPSEAEGYVLTQVERFGVLVQYVEPFARYSSMNRPAYVRATGLPRMWEASVREFAQFYQNKDVISQVGLLNDLLVNRLQGLTSENCRARLREYRPGAFYEDFFSSRRLYLLSLADRSCNGAAEADLYQRLTGVAESFTIALDDRFPFSDGSSVSASPARARDFFLNYEEQRQNDNGQAEAALMELGDEAEAFVTQLNESADFFASNLASADGMRPIRVITTFRPNGPARDGTDQVYEWRMGAADSESVRPSGQGSFDWNFGEPLEFAVIWADQSHVAPRAGENGAMPQLGGPGGRSASFRVSDPWALLTMIDRYRVPRDSSGVCNPLDSASEDELVLCFPIQVASKDAAETDTEIILFYVQLELQGLNTTTNEWEALSLPTTFPHSVPEIEQEAPRG